MQVVTQNDVHFAEKMLLLSQHAYFVTLTLHLGTVVQNNGDLHGNDVMSRTVCQLTSFHRSTENEAQSDERYADDRYALWFCRVIFFDCPVVSKGLILIDEYCVEMDVLSQSVCHRILFLLHTGDPTFDEMDDSS